MQITYTYNYEINTAKQHNTYQHITQHQKTIQTNTKHKFNQETQTTTQRNIYNNKNNSNRHKAKTTLSMLGRMAHNMYASGSAVVCVLNVFDIFMSYAVFCDVTYKHYI